MAAAASTFLHIESAHVMGDLGEFDPPTPLDDRSSTELSSLLQEKLSRSGEKIEEQALEFFSRLQIDYSFEEATQALADAQKLYSRVHTLRSEGSPERDGVFVDELLDRLVLVLSKLEPVYTRFVSDGVLLEASLSPKLVRLLQTVGFDYSLTGLGDELCRSGYGILFKHTVEDLTFVTKRIQYDEDDSHASRAAASREAHFLQTLSHPNLLSGFGILHKEGYSDIFMDFIEGPTVADMITSGEMSETLQQQCAENVKSALMYLHEQGAAYCDLKPQNVMYSSTGEFVLIDFGSIRRFGMPPGPTTLAFAPPESIQSSSGVEASFDIWEYGAFLFSLVTNGESLSLAQTPGEAFAFAQKMVDAEFSTEYIDKRLSSITGLFSEEIRTALAHSPSHRSFL